MSKPRKPKPEVKIPVDPKATVFQVGDRVQVIRPNLLWLGYVGTIMAVNGGTCLVRLNRFTGAPQGFSAHVPSSELAHDL